MLRERRARAFASTPRRLTEQNGDRSGCLPTPRRAESSFSLRHLHPRARRRPRVRRRPGRLRGKSRRPRRRHPRPFPSCIPGKRLGTRCWSCKPGDFRPSRTRTAFGTSPRPPRRSTRGPPCSRRTLRRRWCSRTGRSPRPDTCCRLRRRLRAKCSTRDPFRILRVLRRPEGSPRGTPPLRTGSRLPRRRGSTLGPSCNPRFPHREAAHGKS
jgi:hypothetical protein